MKTSSLLRARTRASLFALALTTALHAAQDSRSLASRQATSLMALVGGSVIDGTGAAPRPGCTVLVQGDRIVAVGPAVEVPKAARVVDVHGKTVVPGMIDMHGHLYANTGAIRNQFAAYPKLYLAGGVTTVFTPGDFDPEGTLQLRERIRAGKEIGARVFSAGPYFDLDPSAIGWIKGVASPEEARAKLEQWKEQIDGVKVYTRITEAELEVVLKIAHGAGLRVTGHLGSVTATRAIELGIDRLEHGIFAMSDFKPTPLSAIDLDGPVATKLLKMIVERRVVIDPTMVVSQTGLPDFAPVTPDYEKYLGPRGREMVARLESRASRPNAATPNLRKTLAKQMEFVKKVHDLGGIVVAGTDPVHPILIPGYALHRELKNLVDAGLTPLQAIRCATANAAWALGKEKDFGTIQSGKIADLVVVDGDPATRIEDIGNTRMVFQAGVMFDPVELRKSVEGLIN